MNLNDGWNAFNHNLNYLPQVIIFQCRILFFELRELNLQALAQSCENNTANCKILPSGSDLAAPLGLQSYVKTEFMRPQNRPDGKHPDTISKDFRALLGIMPDAIHCVTIYSSTLECIKHKSRYKMYISDEQLHAMELCSYHGIMVQVEGLLVERISQMSQCTGSQSLGRGDRRNDWVWVKQHLGRCYGALNGCLPWLLQPLFKIKLLNKDGAFVEYWLTLELTTIPQNSGYSDLVSKFVQVRKAPSDVALEVSACETLAAACT